MSELRYYLSRFFRRFPYFLIVATLISAVAVIVALTLPPAYESNMRLIVESKQIPDELARSTVSTSATEQLQIMQQRLLTRENLLGIANDLEAVRDQNEMSPDEIVRAMRAQTRIRSQSGRNQATVMTITFEAPSAKAAAGVLNAYLTQILETDVEFRTGRAVTTLEFFEQQVEQLGQDLDEKSAQILDFKNQNADALPETLDFRMSEQSRMLEQTARIEAEVAGLQNQKQQLVRVARATARLEDTGRSQVPDRQLSPREQRLRELQQSLEEALGVYSEQSVQVRQLRARIAQLELAKEQEKQALLPEASDGSSDGTSAETGDDATAETADGSELSNPLLDAQLADLDAQIAVLEDRKVDMEAQLEVLRETVSRTPANAIVLDGLQRDYENIQRQYNTAVDRLSRASTGERIELLSRGQRITVIEPPAVPNAPTKPNRTKLAGAGSIAGILAGLALVYLLEVVNRTPRRPEDIVARFEVMPIATIPYVRSRHQMFVDRGVKMILILIILIGVPAAIYAVHEFYMPLDLVADKVMNRLGVRW